MTLTFTFVLPSGSTVVRSFSSGSVRDMQEFLSKIVRRPWPQIALYHQQKPLNSRWPISSLGLPTGTRLRVVCVAAAQREISFHFGNREPFTRSFPQNATVADAKRAIAPTLQCRPELLVFSLSGRPIRDRDLVSSLRIPVGRPIIVTKIAVPTERVRYTFVIQGEAYKITLDPEATVRDAIAELTAIAQSGTEKIVLRVDGRPLQDDQIMSTLNIEGFINADTVMHKFRPLSKKPCLWAAAIRGEEVDVRRGRIGPEVLDPPPRPSRSPFLYPDPEPEFDPRPRFEIPQLFEDDDEEYPAPAFRSGHSAWPEEEETVDELNL